MRRQPARRRTVNVNLPKTSVTWVLVAHRGGARLFERAGDTGRPRLRKVWDHAEGRLQDRELKSDRGGRLFSLDSSERHAVEPRQSPSAQVADDFARELVDELHAGRGGRAYDRLLLVAAPRFLGRLRASLDAATARTIIGAEAKDLAWHGDRDLARMVEALLDRHAASGAA